MNWLGAGLATLLAALCGVTLGGIVHFEARRHGLDFPPLVGLLAGMACALASRGKSGLRGAFVASLSVWAAALAEVLARPVRGVIRDILAFHERLGLVSVLAYLACAGVAALLGARGRKPLPLEARIRKTGSSATEG
jgi:hypothetical protein